MTAATAPAKINLALVIGPLRPDGLHEVATILQRIDLADEVSVEPSHRLEVEGFAGDTLVTRALEGVAAAAGVEPAWHARIEKRIPVAAGLGGGSSDAATALRLANDLLDEPLPRGHLARMARGLGADVPFFLEPGPQLGTGDGSRLRRLDLPQDYGVLLLLPEGAHKDSTAAVYARFDGGDGFEERHSRLVEIAERATSGLDLADLPPNDLATSPLAAAIRAEGAFRADVSGAGPVVYGLFTDASRALAAASRLTHLGRTWIAAPAW